MKLIGIILILLVAFIAMLLHDEWVSKPEAEREMARNIEISRHRREMARSRGYDVHNGFNAGDFNDAGYRVDGRRPDREIAAATPIPKPGDWMYQQSARPLDRQR